MIGTNIGIDLGTTSVVIYVEGKGIVLSEPCAAAYDVRSGKLLAVGKKAFDMYEKNPDTIRVVKPMTNGIVSDFTATKHILRSFLSRICKTMVFKPNVVACVPSMVTSLEKRTILDLITSAGAAKACLIEEPLAAALGAGLGSDRPKGAMVVDIGGGTTDIAVITNIGSSHLENLGTRENIALAKLEITEGLADGGVLIMNGDEPLLRCKKNISKNTFFVSLIDRNCDYYAYNIKEEGGFTKKCNQTSFCIAILNSINQY